MENTQNDQAGNNARIDGANGTSGQGSLDGVGGSLVGGSAGDASTPVAGSVGASSNDDPKKNPPKPPAEPLKGRVLRDGAYGKINDVVTLTEGEARKARKSGDVDTSPAAVEYAELIKVVS